MCDGRDARAMAISADAIRFVDAVPWRDYVHTLYGDDGKYATQLPIFEDVELIYDQLLGSIVVDMQGDGNCPRKVNMPFLLRAPHSPLVPWFKRKTMLLPSPSFTWIEVTHCAGSRHERAGAWFYAARGSALFINIGHTRIFHSHADAARHFLGGSGCADDTCNGELPRIAWKARVAGLDSLQFLGHCDLDCDDCAHEIMLSSFSGETGCPAGIEFRTGVNASRVCTCEQTIALRSARGFCATCKEWGLPSRESPAVAQIGGLERWWGCHGCKWETFTAEARSIGTASQQNGDRGALHDALHALGLEQHAKRLMELGHSERELRRMDWGTLSLLARNQLRLTGRSRSKFVAAFAQCHNSQADNAAAPRRLAAACMASTLSVASADQWRGAIASLRAAHVDEATIVTPLTAEAASPPVHFAALLAEHRSMPRLTLHALKRRAESLVETLQGSNHAERAANRWMQVTLQLKQSCWEHFEVAERTRGHAFATLIYLRADSAWLPGTSLPTLLAPIQSLYLRAEPCKDVPCLFVPDTENYWSGTNDRFGIMNRAAGAAYFDGWKRLSRRSRWRTNNAERELALTLNESGVRVRTFPTLSALTCCLNTRKGCWRSQCHTLCHPSNARGQGFKYQFEAHAAAANAQAVRSREQCFGRCHADAGVCLRPEARRLTASTAADFFWVFGHHMRAANGSCAGVPLERRKTTPPPIKL